jgi:hypothetical protein
MTAVAGRHALGITLHTGWGACVVVAGSARAPEIVAHRIIEVLEKPERFCFHRAAEMDLGAAQTWINRLRRKALENATRALSTLISRQTEVCALVARPGAMGELSAVLSSHPRIHSAEGCFYRDILAAACTIPVRIVPPSSLDISTVGKLAHAPWGRDQKLAALAAWSTLAPSLGRDDFN